MSRLKQRWLVFDDTLSLMRVPGGVAMDEWQTVSNGILGWTILEKRDYYVRQFRDMKGAVTVERMDGFALMDYTRVCGPLLEKGHARSADPAILTGYLGNGHASDRAFARFTCGYVGQTEPTITHSNRQSSPVVSRPNLLCNIRWRRCEARWIQSSKLPYVP